MGFVNQVKDKDNVVSDIRDKRLSMEITAEDAGKVISVNENGELVLSPYIQEIPPLFSYSGYASYTYPTNSSSTITFRFDIISPILFSERSDEHPEGFQGSFLDFLRTVALCSNPRPERSPYYIISGEYIDSNENILDNLKAMYVTGNPSGEVFLSAIGCKGQEYLIPIETPVNSTTFIRNNISTGEIIWLADI